MFFPESLEAMLQYSYIALRLLVWRLNLIYLPSLYSPTIMLLIDGKHVIDAFRAKKDSERGKYAHLKPKLVLSFLLNGWIGNVYHGINLCSLQEVFNVPVRLQQFKTQSYGIINVVHLFFSEKSLFLTLMNRCRSASSGWWQSCRCT